MTEIMRHSFLCGKGSQIFPRTLLFFFLETKLDHMRARLRHTVPCLQARQYRSCHQGELPSGKFKEYEHAKCRRVVKTRESGGKIRQDSKIENQ